MEMLQAYGNEQYDGTVIPSGPRFLGSEFTNDKCIVAYKFASPLIESRRDQMSVPVVGAGINTAAGSSQLFFTLQKSTVATTYNLYTVTYSDALLVIKADGSIQMLM